jgi:aminoglycoside phosphotransferase (APT) family kinase protein
VTVTADALLPVARRAWSGAKAVTALRRLSGGASRESWAFDVETPDGSHPLILRRLPGAASTHDTANPLSLEADLQTAAAAAGVPAAKVRARLMVGDGLGDGFLMDRIPGETLARRILRDDRYAHARRGMTAACGEILARLHGVTSPSPDLRQVGIGDDLGRYREIHDGFGEPRPVMELAFAWLAQNRPPDSAGMLVHGDFRNGNFVVDEGGIRAVLDWELAHIGDPMLDLAWVCVPAWRFGELDCPVGGFGDRADLFSAYEAAGGRVDTARVRFWEIFGTLKWGVMCQMLSYAHLNGEVNSVERAAIGRRVSETELDLLMYLDGSMP